MISRQKPNAQQQSIFTDADEAYLAETIAECKTKLKSALTTADRYSSQAADLSQAIGSAFAGCQQAFEILSDLEARADG